MFWAEIWKISEFLYLKTSSFGWWNFQCIWIGVFSKCVHIRVQIPNSISSSTQTAHIWPHKVSRRTRICIYEHVKWIERRPVRCIDMQQICFRLSSVLFIEFLFSYFNYVFFYYFIFFYLSFFKYSKIRVLYYELHSSWSAKLWRVIWEIAGLVYKFRKLYACIYFSTQFRKTIIRYIKIGTA